MMNAKNDNISPSALEMDLLTLLCDKTLYGLQIMKAIETASAGKKTVKQGSLYTTLHRMERKKLVVSKWEQGEQEERNVGARRKYYAISDLGQTVLRDINDYRRKLLEYIVPENLSNWFQGRFAAKWLPPKDVLEEWQIALANTTGKGIRLRGETLNSAVERVKVFEWEDKHQKQRIALLVALTPHAHTIEVHIRLYPLASQLSASAISSKRVEGNELCLTPNLKLRLIEESGQILKEVISRSDHQDDCIQLPIFECDFGEKFECQIELDELFLVSEKFSV